MRDRLLLPLLLLALLPAPALAQEAAEITVTNRSPHPIRLAAPGAERLDLEPGASARWSLQPQPDAAGVDAKAWFRSDPRQLCVIFSRYGGTITVTGERIIRCLGA